MTRALALISGGLDSTLAAKLIMEQGIEVIGICFKSYFFGPANAIRMTEQIKLPLEVIDFSEEHFNMTKDPKHGHGKNMNPCIDCHAMMMRYAGELLDKYKADFMITGEVLNQRPMSQNKASLNIVKKESGFSDKILRPLSAKVLPPTEMELNGLVDREKLLDISGRSRKIQMELADKWGIVDYPSPAGGCKLTEPNFAIRLRDLVKYIDKPLERDIQMLKIGRHFRLGEKSKIISTRTGEEALEIKKYLNSSDTAFLIKEFAGSTVVIIGEATKEDIIFAARVAARYSKGKDEKILKVIYGNYGGNYNKFIEVESATEKELKEFMIG